jgi:hypothetical protein
VGLIVGLLPLPLQAFGYELSRGQGYVVLVIIGLCVVGVIVALAWPDSPSGKELQVKQYERRVEEITRLRELLLDNEYAFQALAHPYMNDPENRGKEAQENYGALDRYYHTSTNHLADYQLCQKIEMYLSIAQDVLRHFFQLHDPNDARRAMNLPSDPKEQQKMRASIAHCVYADLPNLRKEIEGGFSEALRQS